jgi:hypothetical protein
LSDWKPRALMLRLALPAVLLGAGAGATLLSLPASAGAALPSSFTQCSGFLNSDSSGKSAGEPNLLDYTFNCSTDISSYSVIVDRIKGDGSTIDYFSPSANVVLPTPYALAPTLAGTVSTTEGVNCGGVLPSNGVNCFATNGTIGTVVSAGDSVEGSFDPTTQYCAYLPKGAKAGTPAVPRAIVELVVTDNTGAQDGPFELKPKKACAKVAAVVPAKKAKKTKKSKTKSKTKTTSKK